VDIVHRAVHTTTRPIRTTSHTTLSILAVDFVHDPLPARLTLHDSRSFFETTTIKKSDPKQSTTMSAATTAGPLPCCRVLVVGADRQRVQKAISLIALSEEEDTTVAAAAFEFIPCTAHFDSYERPEDGDDNDGSETKTITMVRYLVQLKAYTANGAEPRSLLPLFDDAAGEVRHHDADTGGKLSFPPIAGVAIGSGLESEDGELIRSFVLSMLRLSRDDVQDNITNIPVVTIRPNPEFSTMAEEMRYYRDLSAAEKAMATQLRTMGPGKMAAFVTDFALRLVQEYYAVVKEAPPSSVAIAGLSEEAQEEKTVEKQPFLVNRDKPMYLCCKCRTPLFGIDSLHEHESAQHHFSHRKQQQPQGVVDSSSPPPPINKCQSIFLDTSLPWMGGDMDANEGKFACPTCQTKLGGWNWSGAQCSCGTWVVPAIQIPRSRVDLYESPRSATELPPGTVLGAALLWQQQQQQKRTLETATEQ
jgi:dual specificity phosphatase 12